ncbi:izumo sperm-egg fusion protein 1-like [Hyla sarda]|uniref:izumo sperm-egg fusion protein 1-like n=1 Tax=Hyla sarda TaxID=327740 RepID=UPI0024C3B222|nr:izumo sperm-egg fusion protein 1-like [Hyla sarda]
MMWSVVFGTWLLIAQSLGCIPCNKRGLEALEKLKIFIQDQVLVEETAAYVTIKNFANAAKRQIEQYLEDVGTLDEYALSEIGSEYKISVNIIVDLDSTGVNLLNDLEHQFKRLKEKIENIVQEAEKRRCPNKKDFDNCGLLVQTLTNCRTCEKEKTICAGGSPGNQEYFDKCTCICTTQNKCFDLKSGDKCTPCKDMTSRLAEVIDCGERNIAVTEDHDVLLACNLEWYPRLEDGYKNIFSKTSHPAQRVTEDPYIELKEIQKYEAGQYICTTILNSGVPIAKYTYNVKVGSGLGAVTEIDKPVPTLPAETEMSTSEPLAEDPTLKLPDIAAYVAGAITLSLFAGLGIFMYLRKSKKAKDISPV